MLMLSCEYNSVIFPCDSVPPTQLLRSSVELQGTITVITLIFSSSLFLLITFSIKWFIWAMQMPGNMLDYPNNCSECKVTRFAMIWFYSSPGKQINML